MVTGFLSLRHRKGLRAHYSVCEDEDDDGFARAPIITVDKRAPMAPYMSDKEGDGCFLGGGRSFVRLYGTSNKTTNQMFHHREVSLSEQHTAGLIFHHA